MPLFIRRIVFYALLIAFIIIAPLLIARTAGYRWSGTQRRFLNTGALSLASTPDNAEITINQNKHNNHTPTLLTNLLPGNYDIEVKKESYYPWKKTLPIESERTTFATVIPLFKEATPQQFDGFDISPSTFQAPEASIESLPPFFVFRNQKSNTIVVVNNDRQKRIAEINGSFALWREKPSPLLFVYSSHEVWQIDPSTGAPTLVTRLIEEIQQVITLPRKEAIILILKDRVRALELDTRDRQNSWDLAQFDEIKNASLLEDGKTLVIEGTRDSKAGLWVLE